MTKIINLYGSPSSGNSTTAAHLFALMKQNGAEVELVTEFAKELVWDERHSMFTEQDYIFAKQNHKLRRLHNKVDFVITDSPLLLGIFHIPPEFPGASHFVEYVKATYDSYNNTNIFLNRTTPYNPIGCNQTEEQSARLGRDIHSYLNINHYIDYEYDVEKDVAEMIFMDVIPSII